MRRDAARRTRRRLRLSAAAIILIGGAGVRADSPTFTFQTIDPPTSGRNSILPLAHGINDSGQIVIAGFMGRYVSSYLYSSGTYTSIDVPGATGTEVGGINNDGTIVGTQGNSAPGFQGFVLSGGTYSTLDFKPPGQNSTLIEGISNSGSIVGIYADVPRDWTFFIYRDGSFLRITTPSFFTPSGSDPFGINSAGTIVGVYATSIAHGFAISSDGRLQTIDPPGSQGTIAYGINDAGEIVGSFIGPDLRDHGFVDDNGTFQTVDVPGSTGTIICGINNKGQIVGGYYDAAGSHAFVGSPIPEPQSVALLAAGAMRSRRRRSTR